MNVYRLFRALINAMCSITLYVRPLNASSLSPYRSMKTGLFVLCTNVLVDIQTCLMSIAMEAGQNNPGTIRFSEIIIIYAGDVLTLFIRRPIRIFKMFVTIDIRK